MFFSYICIKESVIQNLESYIMKSTPILIFAIVSLLFYGPLSAQSKKELLSENEKLKQEQALLLAKLDSTESVAVFLHSRLDDQAEEMATLERKLLNLEAYFISITDTTAPDSVEKERAIAWNDTVVHDQKKMFDLETVFINSIVDGKEMDEINESFEQYVAFLNTLEKKYKETTPFDERDTFRKAMLDLLKIMIDVAETEYTEMISIYSKAAEALTDQDFERWEELTDKADEKETYANDIFLLKQKVFAIEYHFELQD